MDGFAFTLGRALRRCCVLFICLWTLTAPAAPHPLTIATYNIENYLLEPSGGRSAKSEEAKRKVVETVRRMSPDIIAFQEVGGRVALDDLQSRLAATGSAYPHLEIVAGHDPYIAVALLSRLPIVARRSETNQSYVWMGRRFFVGRGFLEVDVHAGQTVVTVIAAHLKSRRELLDADQAELRQQEAQLLRRQVDRRFQSRPEGHVVVLGDFNDTHDSKAIRSLMGRGNTGLFDLRPGEKDLDCPASASGVKTSDLKPVAWTHHYGREDTYSRVDYILVSRSMQRMSDREGSYVAGFDGWSLASDHRPVIARFRIPIETR